MNNILIEKNSRVDVADVLRGLAVMGIIVLHSIEHFNFYSFPDPSQQPVWLNFTDSAIWKSLFFLYGGKAYGVFALLFGFSFYIQDDNQRRRGNDFRLRFMWRLVLLFIIGNFNALFFTAEILVMYSLIGFILVAVCRLSSKTIFILAVVLLLQPLEWLRIITHLINPDYILLPEIPESEYWSKTFDAQFYAGFWEMCKVNLREGQLANLAWAWNHGRIFQTAALFLFGFLIGRTQFLLYSEENRRWWRIVLGWALICYFPLTGLNSMLPDYINSSYMLISLQLILQSLSNFCFMWLLITGVLFLYYLSNYQKLLKELIPYGRMSLGNYISQSIIGSLFFYNWGFGLHKYMGITVSFVFGILLFLGQFYFCRWWLSKYNHGPFEYVWKKATWIQFKKKAD